MTGFVSKAIGVLKIPNTQTQSNAIKCNEVFEDAESIILYGRNVTDGVLTYKIQVSPDEGSTWYDLETAAAAVVAAPNITGKARHYAASLDNWWGTATQMRIVSSAVVAADRFWEVTKRFSTD